MSNKMNMHEAMAILRPLGITRVLTIDTEFRLDENFRQHVVCIVAHEYPSGRTYRIWLDDNPKQPFQLPCDDDTLWVSYVATAELRSMLALGHRLPKRVLDLYVENRWLHNLQESNDERHRKKDEKFFGLTATLRRFGCDSMGAEEKNEMRELILRGGTYAEQQKIAVRNVRRDANEHVKKLVKDKLASEDDQKRSEAEIQKITDKHIADIDQMVHGKEQEIMAV